MEYVIIVGIMAILAITALVFLNKAVRDRVAWMGDALRYGITVANTNLAAKQGAVSDGEAQDGSVHEEGNENSFNQFE